MTNRYCLISMSEFTSQYGYTVPDLILFKVRAHNDQGPATLSEYNTGSVQTQTTPTAKPSLSATSTESTVSLTWT